MEQFLRVIPSQFGLNVWEIVLVPIYNNIIQIFQKIFPSVFIIYLLVGLLLANVIYFKYNRPILEIRRKVQETKEKYSGKTGLKSFIEPRINAEIEPFREQIAELEIRKRFFLEILHILYPWIRL